MQLKLFSGYPDNVGRRHTFCGQGFGPAAGVYIPFNETTLHGGDPVQPVRFQWYFDSIWPTIANDEQAGISYLIWPIPLGPGPRNQWVLKYTLTTGVQIGAGLDLSHLNVILAGFGGQY
jgi:hypothetical protein